MTENTEPNPTTDTPRADRPKAPASAEANRKGFGYATMAIAGILVAVVAIAGTLFVTGGGNVGSSPVQVGQEPQQMAEADIGGPANGGAVSGEQSPPAAAEPEAPASGGGYAAVEACLEKAGFTAGTDFRQKPGTQAQSPIHVQRNQATIDGQGRLDKWREASANCGGKEGIIG